MKTRTSSRTVRAGALALLATVSCSEKKAEPNPEPESAPRVELSAPNKEAMAAIVATCAQVHGDVQIRREGETEWAPAAVGATLREGDTVKTAAGATAALRFSDKGSLALDESTRVVIDTAAADPGQASGVVVSVDEGAVTGRLAASGDERSSIGVRSGDGSPAWIEPGEEETEFRLRRGSDGVEISSRSGHLNVAAGSTSLELTPGEATELEGDDLSEKMSLIRFPGSVSPGIDARFQFQDAASAVLVWNAVEDAAAYRLQIARDLSFQELVESRIVEGTRHAFAPGEAGMYVWRIASRDGDGRTGEFGFARRLFFETRPIEDLLVSPKDKASLAYDKRRPEITFSWQSPGEAGEFRLQVGRGGAPHRDPVIDITTTGQSYTTNKLAAGRYVWGVYAEDTGGHPLFTTPRTITIVEREAPKADTRNLWK